MRKFVISMWLLMLSMVATAQTFVIKDKNGNSTTYDVSKVEKITFQDSPPGFTVFEEKDESSQSEEPAVEQTSFAFSAFSSGLTLTVDSRLATPGLAFHEQSKIRTLYSS